MDRYDRALCLSSLWVAYAAAHVVESDVMHRLSVIVLLLLVTLVSLRHWADYENTLFYRLDLILSTAAFLLHVYLAIERKCLSGALFAALGAGVFGLNTCVLRCRQREKHGPSCPLNLIPHASFRFFSFWFVMSVHDQPFSWILSVVYWITLFTV